MFDNTVKDYLLGNKFSNSLRVKVAQRETSITSRLDKLVELSAGKKVLHLGFADHLPLIEEKIKNRRWLHTLLCESAKKCVGLDINGEAIGFIEEKIGIKDLYKHDIVNDPILDVITAEKWDYIIIGEVLEHIDNPVAFLTAIKKRYANYIDRVIITVPNAFDLQNIRLLKKNIEFINTDHRYWFTPYTLAKVCTEAGYSVDDFVFCQSYMPSGYFDKLLLKKRPVLREGILMIIS